jgi:hypothetical protein
MTLWRRKRRGDQPEPEPMSDKQRLEHLLDRLADKIGENDEWDRRWSRDVRARAGQIRAGQASGLVGFLRLFDKDPRNTINDQSFAQGSDFEEAYRLATELLAEHHREMSSPA